MGLGILRSKETVRKWCMERNQCIYWNIGSYTGALRFAGYPFRMETQSEYDHAGGFVNSGLQPVAFPCFMHRPLTPWAVQSIA